MLILILRQFDYLPVDLVPIVAGYAVEIPYIWHPKQASMSVYTNGDTVKSYGRHYYCRIGSDQSIVTGSQRWRITGTIQRWPYLDYFAVGITTADPRPTTFSGPNYYGNDTALVAIDGDDRVLAFHADKTVDLSSSKIGIRRNATKYSIGIDIDIERRLMMITFDDPKRINRAIRFPIPVCMDIQACRPCVVVYGFSNATIRSWPDDGGRSTKPVRKPVDVVFYE